MEAVKRRNRIIYSVFAVFVFALIAFGFHLINKPTERSYGFVTVGHPVSMWHDGRDRWAYFSLYGTATKQVAAKARTELVSQGFTEDTSMKPWFRFVKGNEEVVVCNHDEFAVNGCMSHSKLVKEPGGRLGYDAPCVLVKNGPGSKGSLFGFHLKKLAFRW